MKPHVLLLLLGVAGLLAAVAANAALIGSGVQPWGPTLLDNMVFARSIPFLLGLGVATGAAQALVASRVGVPERRADGAVRRFDGATVAMHWVFGLGFLVAIVTGAWQYLKGVLDQGSPIGMPTVYRLHYLGAALMLFGAAHFVTYWLTRGDRSLLVPSGQWIRHLRGLAHELPRVLGGTLGALLGLNMKRAAPAGEQFTYYEKVISFPTWLLGLALILVTGILKALRYVYPIPDDVLWWASSLHVAAMVILSLKLMDHMRYVMGPDRWPLFKSMVNGWVSERYVRRKHAAWVGSETPEPGADAHRGAPTASPAAAPVLGSATGGGTA